MTKTVRAVLVLGIVLTACVGSTPVRGPGDSASAQPRTRPNVLIVVTDDQRPDTMQVMPRTREFFETSGVSYDNAYATTPLCCPSRASIFTGRFVHNHRVVDTKTAERLNHASTLHAYLQDAGYATAISGKFLNLWPIHSDPPHFDKWAIFNDDYGVDGYRNEEWNVNGTVRDIAGYTTTVVGDKAVDFLSQFESDDAKPWLLYVWPFAPHSPYTPEAKYATADVPAWKTDPSTTEQDLSDKPRWVRDQQVSMREARKARTGQLRTLMSVDDQMGRLIETMDALQETGDTMVFFTSDNGYLWHDHGLLAKRQPYTPSVKIPFLFRYPGANLLGNVDPNAPIANIDIAPTALEAAGVAQDLERPMDGRPLITGAPRTRMLLEYFVEMGVPTWASTVTAASQYVEYYANDGTTIRFRELYQLDADPYQLRNVLNDGTRSNDPSRSSLRTMHEQLAADRNCRGEQCP